MISGLLSLTLTLFYYTFFLIAVNVEYGINEKAPELVENRFKINNCEGHSLILSFSSIVINGHCHRSHYLITLKSLRQPEDYDGIYEMYGSTSEMNLFDFRKTDQEGTIYVIKSRIENNKVTMWTIGKLFGQLPLFYNTNINLTNILIPPSSQWKDYSNGVEADISIGLHLIDSAKEIVMKDLPFVNTKSVDININGETINYNRKKKFSILHLLVGRKLGNFLKETYLNVTQAIDSIVIDGLLNNAVLKDAFDEIMDVPFNEV